MEKQCKILVTAIGSFSADIVIKKLHQNGCFVIGTDIYPGEWVVNAHNVDKFYRVPGSGEAEKYISRLLEICKENEIDFIFPLTDPEVDILNVNRDCFSQLPVQLCMSDFETICVCRDKRKSEELLRSANICTLIDSYDYKEVKNAVISYPIVCKPVNGRSSQGLKIFDDFMSFSDFYDRIDPSTYLFQPYIAGCIITVDVVRDHANNSYAVSRRELIRTSIGAGISVQVFRDDILEENAKKIAEQLDIVGCVNFEFIEASDGKQYFLECNPRFSGGVAFSVLSGYDFVTNHLKCFKNERIETSADIKEYFISRKYEEYITGYKKDFGGSVMYLEKVYEELIHSQYPVFIWGAGSMSLEVEKRLKERGIHSEGRFINTKIEQSHIIPNRGGVFCLNELEGKYAKINVVMGHGHYEKVSDIRSYSFINEVYIIPNPYACYKGPSLQYVHDNPGIIDYIKEKLTDEYSRRVLEKYIAVSVTNDIRHLLEDNICVGDMFGLDELNISTKETYVDIGAWEGDTIELFLNRTNNCYDHIYGVEPDLCTFTKLKNRFNKKPDMSLFQCGLGAQEGEFYLSAEDSQSTYLSQVETNVKQKVSVTTMDNLFADKSVSLVKIFVPFMFLDILRGGKNTIKQNRPRLIINVAADDKFRLYDTVRWITNLDMNYKLALRFDFPMPTRLTLYAY